MFTRLRMAAALVAVFALFFVGFSSPASAQDDGDADAEVVTKTLVITDTGHVIDPDLEPIDGPGDLSGLLSGDEVLGLTFDSDAFAEVNPVASTDAATTTDAAITGASDVVGGTGGGLAVTGSDVEPIVAISVGLLAVGGSALVTSRRRVRDLLR